MSVRRLAPKELQPGSFAFTEENLAWAKTQIAKYPEGRQASAVIPILWRAQEQAGGWISEAAIRNVAEMLGMAYIRVLEVATFYTQFQLQPVGRKAHVQVCGTTPCQLRGSDELFEVCKHRIHHDPFHVSSDGDFSWEEVECLGACVNAPMVLIGSDTYEDLTKDSFNKVLDGFASGNPPTPGPQNGRQFSAPIGGITTLKSNGVGSAIKSAPKPATTDAESKKPGEAANTQERPAPKPPAADATKTS
jgi:NADH-quinone oxidoreductase subunit E